MRFRHLKPGYVLSLSALSAVFVVIVAAAIVGPHEGGPKAGARGRSADTPLIYMGRLAPQWGHCQAPPVPGKKGSLGPRSYAERSQAPAGLFRKAAPETVRVLGIRVDFEDAPMESSKVYFERVLGFVSEYYRKVSHGRVEFAATVTDSVYRLPRLLGYYGDDAEAGSRGVHVIWDAVKAADPEYDFSMFRGAAIIHSFPGQESDVNGDSEDQIWSAFYPGYLISSVMSDTLKREVPGVPTFDVDAHGDTVFVEKSVVLPETEDQDGYRFGSMGVYCHEHGHFFGLPDLYNTLAATSAGIQGAGNWSVMATGTWNANGYVPAEPDAWSRAFLGWVDPVEIAGDADISLPPVEEAGPDTIVVRVPLAGDEYYLIENRLQDLNGDDMFNFADADSDTAFSYYTDSYEDAEFDFFLPGDGTGSGLLIWHIDESVIDYAMYYNVVQGDPLHKGVDLEEADGIQDLDGPLFSYESFGSPFDAFREGNNTDFTPDTDPDSRPSFGGPSDVYIENVSVAGRTMRFSVRFRGGALPGWPVSVEAPLVGNPVAADILGDAGLEVVAVDTAGRVHLWGSDGRALAGWPVETGRAFAHEPLVGDLGAGRPDIAAVAEDGTILAWRADGTPIGPAEGIAHPAGARAGRAIGALHRTATFIESRSDLVIGSDFVDPDSTMSILAVVRFFPAAVETLHVFGATLSPPATFPPATDVLPLDGRAEVRDAGIAVVAANAKDGAGRYLWVYQPSGLPEPALRAVPLGVTFDARVSAPSLGDVDRDGFLDVTGISGDGFIHALRIGSTAEGDSLPASHLPGWPFAFDAVDSSEVSLADVDGNGRLDVLAVGTGARVIAVNHHGVPLPGWPKTIPQSLEYVYEIPRYPAPLAIDLDGGSDDDPARDLLVVLGDGRVTALASDKSEVPGWPVLSTSGSVPFFGDVDADGTLDVIVFEAMAGGGRVCAREAPGRPAAATGGWASYRHDPARTGMTPVANLTPLPRTGAALAEAYAQPNPMTGGKGWFHYTPGPGVDRVEIAIYDVSGRLVRRLAGSTFASSDNLVRWDGFDESGTLAPSGLYLCRIFARASARGEETATWIKFAVLR